MAEEATQAARATAEEAHRQAQQLAGEAEQEAQEADARLAVAERIGESSKRTAKEATRELKDPKTNGDLESRNKGELLDLAATIDIEGRTRMSKAELITAITRASATKT